MRGEVIRRADWRGGIDYRGLNERTTSVASPDDDLSGTHVREAVNVFCDANGTLRRRSGFVTGFGWRARSYGGATAGSSAQWLPGQNRAFLISAAADLYAISSGGTATKINGANLLTQARWTEAPASGGQGPVWGVSNHISGPVQWTGLGDIAAWTATTGTNTNWTYRGTVPNGLYITHFQGRVFIAALTSAVTDLSTVFWSDTTVGGADPRVWPTQNFVRLDPNAGTIITGMIPQGNSLLVFKQNRVFSIYDTATGANRMISASIGAVPGSIAAGPSGEVYFLSAQAGVCVTDGRTVRQIGQPVQAAFMNLATLQGCSSMVFDNHYYLSGLPKSPVSGNNITLDYDIANGSWWTHSLVFGEMFVLTDVNGFQVPYGVESTSLGTGLTGFAYRLFSRTYSADGDSGSVGGSTPTRTYSAEMWLPWEDVGRPDLRKRLRRLRLVGRGGIDVQLSRDWDDSTLETLVSNGLGTGTQTASQMLDVPVNGRVGRAFGVRLVGNADTDTSWQVNDLTYAMTMRKD